MDLIFERSALELAVKLLKACYSEKENVLISAVSVTPALVMAANGAEGETKKELSDLFSKEVSLAEYNEAAKTYYASIPSTEECRVSFANSMWFPEFINVKQEFFSVNHEMYGASVRSLPFDEKAASEINAWVKEKTEGMIDSILDAVTPESLMYLINALAFDGKWQETFKEGAVTVEKFTNIDGTVSYIDGMWGEADRFLQGEGFTGFIKNYKGGRFGFLALLPEEKKSMGDFVKEFSPAGLLTAFVNDTGLEAEVMLPKFSVSYGKELNAALMELGVKKAFTEAAEFSGISDTKSSIGEVIHKTFLEVNEGGTRAAAVTSVMMKTMAMPVEKRQVCLNRPFVYAIMDNEKGIPLFLGTVAILPDIKQEGNEAEKAEAPAQETVSGAEGKELPWWKRAFRKKKK